MLRLLLAMSHHKQLYTELMTTSGLQGILDLVERERSQKTGFDIPTPFDGTELALALQLLLQLIENEPDRLTLINGHSAVKGLSWSKLLPGVHLPLVEDTVLWTDDDQVSLQRIPCTAAHHSTLIASHDSSSSNLGLCS